MVYESLKEGKEGGVGLTCISVKRSRTISSPWAPARDVAFVRSKV